MQKIHPGTDNQWGIFFKGFGDVRQPKYPSWRYHKFKEPLLIYNTDEDDKCQTQGYEAVTVPLTANKNISNWFWDLEDMSAKQLSVFAKEEYDVDLPAEIGQEKLLKAILNITKTRLQDDNSIVYMAHVIKLDYDGLLDEIRQQVIGAETETEVFYL